MTALAGSTTPMTMTDAICYACANTLIFSDREAAHALAADCHMLRVTYQGKADPDAPTFELLRATMVGLTCRYAPYQKAIEMVLRRHRMPLNLSIEELLACWVSGEKPYGQLADYMTDVVTDYRTNFPSCSAWQVSALHHDCNAYNCILPMDLESVL